MLVSGFLTMGSVRFFNTHHVAAIDCGTDTFQDTPSIQPVTHDFLGLTAAAREQFRYVQACDAAMEHMSDGDDAQWKVMSVTNHKVSHQQRISPQRAAVTDRHV